MNQMQLASSRWLAGFASFAVLLIIVSILLSVLNGDEDLLPEDTPEGIVQRYLAALSDGDVNTAYGYIGENVAPICSLRHFIDSTSYQRSRDFSARLARTDELNGSRLVTIEVGESSSNGPFDQGGYTYSVNFILTLENGEWRFTEPPWPMSSCPGWTPRSYFPAPVPTFPATGIEQGRLADPKLRVEGLGG